MSSNEWREWVLKTLFSQITNSLILKISHVTSYDHLGGAGLDSEFLLNINIWTLPLKLDVAYEY